MWKMEYISEIVLYTVFSDDNTRGMGLPNPSRETKFSGANGDREMGNTPIHLSGSASCKSAELASR